jgi:signal transduction histidine kinase/CheY-like chemotaxis protein
MVIWWLFFSFVSLVFGRELRLDHYFIAIMLFPGGLFLKKQHVHIGIAITFLLFFGINIAYFFYTPPVTTPESFLIYRYLLHLLFGTIVVVTLSLYYRWKNDKSETELAEEVKKHKYTSEQLLLANNDKDKFLSIIAHDLKGPIGNIANLLNHVTIDRINPTLLSNLQSSAKNTYELVQDLLTWARAQKGQIELHPMHYNIQEHFEGIIAPLQNNAAQKNINIEILVDNALMFVYSDIPSIKTVIRNIVSNAIKFTFDGGTIQVSAYQENNKVKIVVSDTGVGIAKDRVSQLFKLGSNISSPGTLNEHGTGLGLLLCKEFVELNNGEIGVESEVDKGSTFWFTLPQGKANDTALIAEMIRERKLNTLIVEDNYLNLENTITEVESAGIAYDVARDGKEAMDKGMLKTYDFILMDIDMPKMDGILANKIIRTKYPNAIIIALSSYGKHEILLKDSNVHFNGFLRKPLDYDNLIYTLKELVIDQQ